MTKRIKYGTYAATLAAADWHNILEALCEARDFAERHGFRCTADAHQRTIDKLKEQVTE